VEILFEIQDTGIGIPETRRAAIFEPFTQVDGTTTRKYGGTGLGLAICMQLVALMGGEIGVESEEGKGSTFWFTACFEKQTSGVAFRPGTGVKTSEVLERIDITGTRILVVDDNETNRKLMAAMLKSWGCRHESACSAEAALKLLYEAAGRNDPFRIALLDQMMPVMDGGDLGRRIKADPLLESTLMIMVTSLGRRGEAAVLEQIGFAGYLTKPVRQSQLYDCIVLVLGRAEGNSPETGIVTRHTAAEVAQRGVRILMAEDNVINQKVAQSILGKLGCKADVVANGLEAVRALELINYDLVLMDCQMPEMDGFEATAVIRDPDSKILNHKVPIVALTANAMNGDRERCIEAGMNDYLSKPVKKEDLSVVLEKWLKPKAPEQNASTAAAEASADVTGNPQGAPLLFDKAELLYNFDGDADFTRSILNDASTEIPKSVEMLQESCRETDIHAIRFQAHTIKGIAANLCTPALRDIAYNIETSAKNGDLASARELLPELVQTARMTLEAIRR
jgi:two-component system sensor histidine kinase/response regulator